MEGEPHYGYRLFFMLLVVGANAFLAAAEIALVSVRRSRLQQLCDEGHVGAKAAAALLANPERLLSVIQVGVTLTSLALGWLGEATLHRLFLALFAPAMTPMTSAALSVASVGLAFALMTYMHVVFGEVAPKNLGMERAERVAVIVAPPLLVFYRLVEPFAWVLERSSAAVSRLIGVSGQHPGAHSAEELKFVLQSSRAAGQIGEFEEAAMRRLIELREYSAREVMVPRNQMAVIEADADIDEVLQRVSETRFSRLAVVEKGNENPVGFVHVKDVLDVWAQRRQSNLRRRPVEPFSLKRILRKAPIVPESRPLHLLLEDLREQHAHLAFLVDEFGTVSGLVSLEDVFEQVFGEIEDEFDLRRESAPEEAAAFEVEGTILLRDLETQYGIELPAEGEYETLAGFLMDRLGRIPREGDSVEASERRFTVLEMEFNRIVRVRVEKAHSEDGAGGGAQ
ncbi:MAG: membrane protein [Bryobacteraceae bacterium]|jgi:CBS domain containing-hemolysin-like protein|nr:MAG: membrane protein [Bryobacteraceae bacterium]